MINVKVDIDASKFDDWAKQFPKDIERAVSRMVRSATLLVERFSKINAPVDTGRLRASIASDIHPLSATVQTHTNYAIYVHDGTRFMRPRPFMAEAEKNVNDMLDDIVQAELKNIE